MVVHVSINEVACYRTPARRADADGGTAALPMYGTIKCSK